MAPQSPNDPSFTKPGEHDKEQDKSTVANPADHDPNDPARPGGAGQWGADAHPGEPGSKEETPLWAPPSEATPPYALPGAPKDARPGWMPPGDHKPDLPEGVSPGVYPGVHPGAEDQDAAKQVKGESGPGAGILSSEHVHSGYHQASPSGPVVAGQPGQPGRPEPAQPPQPGPPSSQPPQTPPHPANPPRQPPPPTPQPAKPK